MSHTYTTTVEVELADDDAYEAIVVVTLDEYVPYRAATRHEPAEGGWEGIRVELDGEEMRESHPDYSWLVDCAVMDAWTEEIRV